MRLTDFPAGGTIYLDTNCLVYHFTGTYPSCAELLDRAHQRDIHLVTSAVTLTELHHRLMMLEAAQRFPHVRRPFPSFLKRHPDLIRSLELCERALGQLRVFHIRIVPVTQRLILDARRISHEFGLLTNDALAIATMQLHHIVHLASNDTDFLRIPSITVWRP